MSEESQQTTQAQQAAESSEEVMEKSAKPGETRIYTKKEIGKRTLAEAVDRETLQRSAGGAQFYESGEAISNSVDQLDDAGEKQFREGIRPIISRILGS